MAPQWILFAISSLVFIGALMIAWERLRAGAAPSPRAASSAALYRFHRVHHEGADLHWLDAFRQHPVEFALFQGLGNLPAVILFGTAGHVSLWINVGFRLVTAWLHARGPVSLGPLEYVLTSPSMHHAHHESRVIRNYGGMLSVFDWLFGTAEPTRSLHPTFMRSRRIASR